MNTAKLNSQHHLTLDILYSRRTHILLFIVSIVIISNIIIGCGSFNMNTTVSKIPAKTFHVQSTPELVITGDYSNANIHSGNVHTVIVSGQTSGGMQITTTQQGDTIEIVSKHPSNNLLDSNGRIDITTPPTSNVKMTLGDNGAATIDGVSGTMQVTTTAGSISIRNSTLSGQSNLQSSEAGITFDGKLDAHSKTNMKTAAGDIDVTLPVDAAFVLQAPKTSGNLKNEFGSNTVGNAPRANLFLQITDHGSITVHKKI